MTIRAVFFDVDGTLVDSNGLHVTAWRETLAEAGADFSRETIHGQIGKGADMLIPALLPRLDEAARERLAEAHGKLFKCRYLPRVRPFPMAGALLRRVAGSGRRVVLASSASQEEIDHHFDLLDARDLVSATTSADDVRRSKPAPDIFARALETVAPLSPGEVIVVGDTPYDVKAAKGCGIAAVGLRSGGFADEALLEEGAIALYDDPAALLRDFENSPLTT